MEIPRITPSQVAEILSRGEPVAFADARSPAAYGSATHQIPGSARVPPDDVDAHAADLPRSATVVAYCT